MDSTTERPVQAKKGPLAGARLIIVEDEPIIQLGLEHLLAAAGAEIVATAQTVAEGLELAELDGLAAAILDIRLGNETVAAVARRLKERGVPFVFYSGQVGTDPIRAEWPDVEILPKPSPPREIVTALAQLIC